VSHPRENAGETTTPLVLPQRPVLADVAKRFLADPTLRTGIFEGLAEVTCRTEITASVLAAGRR
jgi:hypothetical protein